MNNYTYASIVPLIGGETFGMQKVFNKRPEYILSYSPFKANDSQLLHHYNNEVPYHLIDESVPDNLPSVDIVNAVCPCAGLSSLSPSASTTNSSNDWMIESAKYVLSTVKPRVFWGENAPRLASKMGQPIVDKLRHYAAENGYTFSLYKTKSVLHGLSQTRDRSFYFFWRGDVIPILPYFRRQHEKIEDTIREAFVSDDDPMNVLTNDKTPSENPFYRYVLEELEGGCTHKEFQRKIVHSINPLDYLERAGCSYLDVAKWMKEHGYNKEATRCEIIYAKLKGGGNIMRKTTEIPKNFIGAFVGHMPTCLTHPDEDRYLTFREALSIMKMPSDFQLQGGKKNLNMICQNVPVTTAADMAGAIKQHLEGKLDTILSDFLVMDNRNQTMQSKAEVSDLAQFMS